MAERRLPMRMWVPGLAALMLGLAGCASSPGHVQVVDRNGHTTESAPRQPVRSGEYVVQRGDTLYSIAFRFGWDWKALAAHNGIREPFTIYPGQRIRFAGAQVATARQNPVVVQPTTQASRPVTATAPATASRPSQPITSTPASTAATPSTTPRSTASTSVSTNTPAATSTPVVRSSSGWIWPASGALIGRFSSNGSLNKGIDIAGELGQPVFAASDGTVVYAGSGLRGYGELLIIKHSDTYVSAYGHNRRLLVQEGQQVKAGQRIAEMGSTGTDRVKLHFEIRRQGKPVDPLQYLPKR